MIARQGELLRQPAQNPIGEEIRPPTPAPAPGTGEETRPPDADAAPLPTTIGRAIAVRSGLGGDLAETAFFMVTDGAHEAARPPAPRIEDVFAVAGDSRLR